MDINICIDKLGLNSNEYRLTQSNPPHSFIEWTGDDTQPTQAELEAAWTSYVAEQSSTEYARNRKAKYDLLNQDELRFDDLENTTTTWQDAINAIKLEYPK